MFLIVRGQTEPERPDRGSAGDKCPSFLFLFGTGGSEVPDFNKKYYVCILLRDES